MCKCQPKGDFRKILEKSTDADAEKRRE